MKAKSSLSEESDASMNTLVDVAKYYVAVVQMKYIIHTKLLLWIIVISRSYRHIYICLWQAPNLGFFSYFPVLPDIRFESLMNAGNIFMLCLALQPEIIDGHSGGVGGLVLASTK